MTCVFCDIVQLKAPATVVGETFNNILIVPLNPVTPGHILVIPKAHVEDFSTNPFISASAMKAASEFVDKTDDPLYTSVNLITSKGVEATQSVFHLHLHIVPRKANDGLALPWYSGKTKKKELPHQ